MLIDLRIEPHMVMDTTGMLYPCSQAERIDIFRRAAMKLTDYEFELDKCEVQTEQSGNKLYLISFPDESMETVTQAVLQKFGDDFDNYYNLECQVSGQDVEDDWNFDLLC